MKLLHLTSCKPDADLLLSPMKSLLPASASERSSMQTHTCKHAWICQTHDMDVQCHQGLHFMLSRTRHLETYPQSINFVKERAHLFIRDRFRAIPDVHGGPHGVFRDGLQAAVPPPAIRETPVQGPPRGYPLCVLPLREIPHTLVILHPSHRLSHQTACDSNMRLAPAARQRQEGMEAPRLHRNRVRISGYLVQDPGRAMGESPVEAGRPPRGQVAALTLQRVRLHSVQCRFN